ncbi:hypothetical protein [Corallococcus sp. 4LFB]|uniref:hypothetical protein n=1 Tax=Corallococcus sp. 4LFB TaxID=3383249 RepID=UPI003976EDA4
MSSSSPPPLLRIAAVATACAALMALVGMWSGSLAPGARIAVLAASAFVLAAVGVMAALRALARSEREYIRLREQADDARALRDAVMASRRWASRSTTAT